MEIVIIGGGMAGLVAAINIKRNNPSANIKIIEKNLVLGRKILATGNGRANLSNKVVTEISYNNDQVFQLIKKYDYKYIKDFYQSIGVFFRSIQDRLYPHSLTASSVVDALVYQVETLGIKVYYEHLVKELCYQNKKWIISTNHQDINADIVVVATGGKSGAIYGSDGTIFESLFDLGLQISDLRPGLCPLSVSKNLFKSISGIRAQVVVDLPEFNYREEGEIIFKKTHISGIVIFNIASILARNNSNFATIYINFIPNFSLQEFLDICQNSTLDILFIISGFVPHALAKFLLHQVKNLDDYQNIYEHLTKFNLNVYPDNDYTSSQVSVGGVKIDEVDLQSFKCKKYPSLYLIGEVLDVDGLCGGYNLHFAVVSGILAGKEIAKEKENE